MKEDKEQNDSICGGRSANIFARFAKWLRNPGKVRIAVALCSALAAVTASSLVAVTSHVVSSWACILYAVTALLFGYAIYIVVRMFMLVKKAAEKRLREREFTCRMLDDYGFRTMVSAIVSFSLAALFAISNGVTSVMLRSSWYGIMAGYYFLLCVLRIAVAAAGSRAGKSENEQRAKLRLYFGSGFALLGLESSIWFVVTWHVLSAGEVVSSRVMTIATAAYTFIKVIMAIINIVRAKRWRDPVVQVVRNINLIDAFVSLLALETSMVAVFGDGTDKLIPLSATLGFVVFAGTVVMALHMIIKAGVELARIRKRTASSVKGDGNE